MISKLIRTFSLLWCITTLSAGTLWSQCVEIKWVMSFDHILARPDSKALLPLTVDFSEIYRGVGKVYLLITFDQDVMAFSAVKNIDPLVTAVEITHVESGVIELRWNRNMAVDRQAINLAGKMLDLEFSYFGGETAVAVSQSEVADIWGNFWQGLITPGSVKQLQAFEVLLRSEPESNGAALTGGGIWYEGDTVVVSANEPFNFRFLRWADDMPYTAIPDKPESLTTSFLMPGRDVSLVAKYEKIMENPVFLTLNTEGYGSMMVRGVLITDTVIVAPQGEVFAIEAKPDTSWVFDRWHGDASGTNPVVNVVMNRDKEVTASFSEVFSVELYADPDTIGAVLTGAGTYRENDRVDIWANTPGGYIFVGWTGASQDMALLAGTSEMFTSFTMPARPVTFAAVFTPGLPDYYTLTLLASPDTIGAVLSQENTGPHQEGARVDILASDVEGYSFSGWVNQDGGVLSFVDDPLQAETFLIMPAGAITLTATYEEIPPPDRLLLIAIVGEGVVTVEGDSLSGGHPISLWFADATEITLTAAASAGWVFDGWSGDLAGEHTEAWLAMDADKTVTVTFTAIPPPPVYTITFSILDQQGEPVTGATISMDDIAYPPGLYVFAELLPGSYSYTVSGTGYFDVSGTVLLVDEDVFTDVVMYQDDTGTDTGISGLQPVRVYPNPVKDIASIDLGAVIPSGHMQVRVIDIQGRIRDVPFYPDAGEIRLDFTGLAPGMYHLQIYYDGNRKLVAFIML